MINDYEEVKDLWDYSTSRGNNTMTTREDYVNKIIKRFNLKKSLHKPYLDKYYTRYMKEKEDKRKACLNDKKAC